MTVPAFSNVSVTGTLEPALIGAVSPVSSIVIGRTPAGAVPLSPPPMSRRSCGSDVSPLTWTEVAIGLETRTRRSATGLWLTIPNRSGAAPPTGYGASGDVGFCG